MQEQNQTPASMPASPAVLDAAGHGTPEATATTVAHAEAGAHHQAFLGLDSYGWVAGAFVIFVALLVYLKAPKAIAAALDARAARIRAELDEARRLREDAEKLLADTKARQAQAAKDAETILANARTEAAHIVTEAKTQAEAATARRTRMAEDKIAAAERAAVQDLRARVATVATEAAKRLIVDGGDAGTQSKLTDQAITEIDRRLH